MGLPITSRRQNKKFFDPTIFQKCWRGVSEQPTFAKQICFWDLVFLLQSHFLKPSNSNKVKWWESRLQIQTRQRGDCSMLVGKSRGRTPFCRTLKIVLPKSRTFRKVFRSNCSTGTVGKYLFSDKVSQGGAVLFAPPRKAVAFLTTPSVCQKHGTGISLPAGSDQGCSPWTSPTFLKNCWIKKLLFACGLWLETSFLGIPPESGSARLGHIPSLPLESQLPLKPCV